MEEMNGGNEQERSSVISMVERQSLSPPPLGTRRGGDLEQKAQNAP